MGCNYLKKSKNYFGIFSSILLFSQTKILKIKQFKFLKQGEVAELYLRMQIISGLF